MKYTLTIDGETLTIESDGALAQDVCDNIDAIWPDAQSVEVQGEGGGEIEITNKDTPAEPGLDDGETAPGMADVGMGTMAPNGIRARARAGIDKSRIIARDGGEGQP